MPVVGFDPTISAGERPQTYAVDRAATGTGLCSCITMHKKHTNLHNVNLTTITSRKVVQLLSRWYI